jgi:hypothetical protein
MSYPCRRYEMPSWLESGPRQYQYWSEAQDDLLFRLYHAKVTVHGRDFYLPMDVIGMVLGRSAQSCFMRRVQGPKADKFKPRPTGRGSVLRDNEIIEALIRKVTDAFELRWA